MSWNRPSNGASPKPTKKPATLKGLVAAVVVVCGAAIAWFVLSPAAPKESKADEKTKGRIKEVTPAPAPKPLVPKPGMVFTTNRFGKVTEHPPTNQWGHPWHWGPNKKLHPAHTSRIDRASLPLYERVFQNSADRHIAGLLVIEPGTDLIGSDEPSPWFLKSFEKSLKEPVLVTHDDTEEVKELKRAVNETKAELKARMDAGEDIVQILTDTRRELRELGAYREELKKQVEEYRKKGDITSADLKDMVDAANKMLTDRGLKNITMPEFFYHNIDVRNKMRKAREAQNAQ